MAKKHYIDSVVTTFGVVNSAGSGDTSATVNLFPNFYDSYLLYVLARVKTVFAGTATGITVKIGDGTTTDRYMKDQPADQLGDLLRGAPPRLGMGFCEVIGVESRGKNITYALQGRIEATFTSASGNFGSLTQGEIEFVYAYIK